MFEVSTTMTVVYYVVAMAAMFVFHVYVHELAIRAAAKVASHTSVTWTRKVIHGAFKILTTANRWIWPAAIVYLHFGANLYELVSVSGAIAVALYVVWWEMLRDSEDMILEYELAHYHG